LQTGYSLLIPVSHPASAEGVAMSAIPARPRLIAFVALMAAVAAWHPAPGHAQPAAAPDTALLHSFTFRPIGPANNGRADAVAGVAGNPNIYYVGTAGGGVFKTTDGGLNWQAVATTLPVSAVNTIAVAAGDPNLIWIGTGETYLRGNISWGNGVYRSTDAGATWMHRGLDDCRAVGRIVIDPRDANRVVVACFGHQFGPSRDRGIYLTTDGGGHWKQTLYRDERSGAIDLVMDPNNPRILFATLWQAYRAPWGLYSGGPGSGLFKSTDGGETWTELEGHGLPTGELGKMGVAIAASDSNRVYAIIEASDRGGLYRSDDGGATWRLVNATRAMTQRPFYYMRVMVAPDDANHVYVPSVPFLQSLDGGQHFAYVPEGGDNHDLWIDPGNARRMILANDGGVGITTNGGTSWLNPSLPIGQFYHVATNNRNPYDVCGEQQDGPSICGPSRSLSNHLSDGGIANSEWYDVAGGESGWVVPDPVDSNIVWASGYQGDLTRYDLRTNEARHVNVWPEDSMGWAADKLKYRFQWTMPVMISPHDHNTVYVGGNVLFRTTDGGQSWTPISGDLTRNDKSKQQRSGGITGDNTSVEYYDTIFSMAESPKQAGVIWVGTDDGLVQLTRDGGRTWKNVTGAIPDLPAWGEVDNIEASPFDPGTAYVPFDFHKLDNNDPYIYKTTDYGATWTSIRSNLPAGSNVHVVREDPVRRGLLYAGTETGLWVSFDDGGHWESLKNNLPTAAVHDLTIQKTANDLVVATHGRGFWILDDLSALQQLTPAVTTSALHLFHTRPVYRFIGEAPFPNPKAWGKNPSAGAEITYYLKSAPKGDLTVTITDAQGHEVRTISSHSVEGQEVNPLLALFGFGPPPPASHHEGINRTLWDLRYEGAVKSPGAIVWQSGGLQGPYALPGTYHVKVDADGQTVAGTIELKADPRSTVPMSDLQAQLTMALELRSRLSEVARMITGLRSVRAQVTALSDTLKGRADAAPVLTAAKDLTARIDAVEDVLTEPKATEPEDVLQIPIQLYNKLSSLSGWVQSGDGAPTRGMIEVHDALEAQLKTVTAQYDALMRRDVAAFNDIVQRQHIPSIVPPGL
jgi:photosystem II stability/assembly factor-like uncharacterized protein